jgi:hypothetical protein
VFSDLVGWRWKADGRTIDMLGNGLLHRRRLARVDQEERIALFLDYENLALGARDNLVAWPSTSVRSLMPSPNGDGWWSVGPTPTGRTSTRPLDAHPLTCRTHRDASAHGASRKNAADIKMAVDAMELAFEREYIRRSDLLR